MKRFRIWVVTGVLAGFGLAALVSSCSKQAPSATLPIATAVTIPAAQLPRGMKGDAVYAQVNRDWVLAYHETWWAEQFKRGAKYDPRFDCNKFAQKFVSDAQFEYYIRNFHSWTNGQALAICTVYYTPQAGIDRVRKGRAGGLWTAWEQGAYFQDGAGSFEWISPAHALLEVRTPKGVEYFEPQPVAAGRGKYVVLTADEQQTIFGRAY